MKARWAQSVSQVGKNRNRCRFRLFRLAALAGTGALLLGAGPVWASFTIDGNTIKIWGTGRNATDTGVQALDSTTAPSSTLENSWKLIAFPNDFIADPYKLGGNFYIPSSVPGNWAGQTGGVNTPVALTLGGEEYRWITYANWEDSTVNTFGINPESGYAQSYFTPALRGPAVPDPLPVTYGLTPPEYYSYIAQTTFTPAIDGVYKFSTNIAADNFIEVFLGGSVSGQGTVTPSISGGLKLLALADENGPGLFSSDTFSTVREAFDIPLNAGQQYVLNYVIRDNAVISNPGSVPTFGSSGFIVGTTAFTYQEPLPPSVPGPVPALGVTAFLRQARRLRRRIARCR